LLRVPSPRFARLLAASLLLAFFTRSAAALDVAGSCSVSFFGTSTLHDFEGSAPCALLSIEAPDATGRHRARAEVAVAQMDTGIASRDAKMRAMFDAERHPHISASFDAIDPAALRAQAPGALRFRLSIHGVEREVTPTISEWRETPNERAHFRATFDVALSDFGLEAPVALGFVRVGDRVKVSVDVHLNARAAAPAPAAAPPQTGR
jgi:polyisoprenoid-binding protein YceI